MPLRPRAALLLLLSCPPLWADELVVLVDTGTEMPMARFERTQLVDGMHRDIGLALAQAMGRTPRFMALPRKRIVKALEEGRADVLCSYMPEWLEGAFGWSQPFIPVIEVLVTDRRGARPHAIGELAGQTIGTVLGYRHPELEEALGKGFIREDGPTSEANLRKLAAGRIRHAVAGKSFLDYRLKLGDPPLSIYPPLVVKSYAAQCAVSAKGRVALDDVNKAIDQILRNGSMGSIVSRYQ
ncbi:MAG: ABC transporter substrate-binding protein [Pseudomonadota bacterium]